jgi:hypothetical protein
VSNRQPEQCLNQATAEHMQAATSAHLDGMQRLGCDTGAVPRRANNMSRHVQPTSMVGSGLGVKLRMKL